MSIDLQSLVGDCYQRLANSLEECDAEAWDHASLCEGWRVREVIAHVTMPARFTEEQFFAELATVSGDFQKLSDSIASRDSELPVAELVANLRSSTLAGWQPPGGGAIGALNHAVVHSLDVTNAIQLHPTYSSDAARAILDSLTTGAVAARFGVDLSERRLEATDLEWSWGSGQPVVATSAELISLACNRTLPAGHASVIW